MKMISAEDVLIGPVSSLPTTIERMREVELDNSPRTVCHYKGVTYVGLNKGKVRKIGGSLQANAGSEFVEFDNDSTLRFIWDVYASLTKWHTLERINVVFNPDSIKNILQVSSGKTTEKDGQYLRYIYFRNKNQNLLKLGLGVCLLNLCLLISLVKPLSGRPILSSCKISPWAGCVTQPSDLSRTTYTCPPLGELE